MHFQWLWASHASHSTKEIITNASKSKHFQWFWASHASHSPEEIMKNLKKSMHVQWLWAYHASHSTGEITKEVWKSIHFQWLLASTLPTPCFVDIPLPNFDQIGLRDDPANVDLVRTLCGPCAARGKNLWIFFQEEVPSTGSTSCPLFLITILVPPPPVPFGSPHPFHTQPCICSVEKGAWEAQNHWKCKISIRFSKYLLVEWEAWEA